MFVRAPHLASIALLSMGCSHGPSFEGHVTDIWGRPVANAEIEVPNTDIAPTMSGADGHFAFTRVRGTFTVNVSADGYIAQAFVVKSNERASDTSHLLQMVPEPERPGFYAVGSTGFVPLVAEPMQIGLHNGQTNVGIADLGDIMLKSGDLRVIFHTPITPEYIGPLNIELHKLAKVSNVVLEDTTAKARDLWVSSGVIPLEYKPLDDRNYDFTARALPAGRYAIGTLGQFDPTQADVTRLRPETIRTAYALTTR